MTNLAFRYKFDKKKNLKKKKKIKNRIRKLKTVKDFKTIIKGAAILNI